MSDKQPLTKEDALKEVRESWKAKKEPSIYIKIVESDLYDWNPGRRMTLLTIALFRVSNEESYTPADSPFAKDYLGWCWAAQWRLALRVGKSEEQIQRDIHQMEVDGVLKVREWDDDLGKRHNEYFVNEGVIQKHKRPEQTADVERPSRYKTKRGANKGSFSKSNQPRKHGFIPKKKEIEEEIV